MINLAIKGHATRSEEVLQILEMLGGKNAYKNRGGDMQHCAYTINCNGIIDWVYSTQMDNIFTLEEFKQKFPYKVGDIVCLTEKPNEPRIVSKMIWEDDSIVYTLKGIDAVTVHPDALQTHVECHAIETNSDESEISDSESEKPNKIKFEYRIVDGRVELIIPSDMIINVEHGSTFLDTRKPEYPKTYNACCEFLGINPDENTVNGYMSAEIDALQKLIVCRNAYWKFVNWQIGDESIWYYTLGTFKPRGEVQKRINTGNTLMAFPTSEMRDEFYNNFSDLIEQCKMLL